MSVADLRRLIQRATPREEDWLAPDRRDFVHREHGHLTFREVVDALDALEFSVDSFAERMRELEQASAGAEADAGTETAVHALFRALEGLELFSPSPPAAAVAPGDGAGAGAAGGLEAMEGARSRGTECFKRSDFRGAAEQYSAAIAAAPHGHADLHAIHSNRSAALLRAGDARAALGDAQRCLALRPEWPKGHFRAGACLRELGHEAEAAACFEAGRRLDPDGDWERELQRCERQRRQRAEREGQFRQLLLRLLPELLRAWRRGGDASAVLQVQLKGSLAELGGPRRGGPLQLRYALLGPDAHLANLAALLAAPCEQAAGLDLGGRRLELEELRAFVAGACARGLAPVHLDLLGPEGPRAAICCVPCAGVEPYLGPLRDPAPPKGGVEGVLKLQRQSGFPEVLPRLLGFQTFPGDLHFPVVDLERDAPGA